MSTKKAWLYGFAIVLEFVLPDAVAKCQDVILITENTSLASTVIEVPVEVVGTSNYQPTLSAKNVDFFKPVTMSHAFLVTESGRVRKGILEDDSDATLIGTEAFEFNAGPGTNLVLSSGAGAGVVELRDASVVIDQSGIGDLHSSGASTVTWNENSNLSRVMLRDASHLTALRGRVITTELYDSSRAVMANVDGFEVEVYDQAEAYLNYSADSLVGFAMNVRALGNSRVWGDGPEGNYHFGGRSRGDINIKSGNNFQIEIADHASARVVLERQELSDTGVRFVGGGDLTLEGNLDLFTGVFEGGGKLVTRGRIAPGGNVHQLGLETIAWEIVNGPVSATAALHQANLRIHGDNIRLDDRKLTARLDDGTPLEIILNNYPVGALTLNDFIFRPFVFFNEDSGHFYELVNSPMTWNQARQAAIQRKVGNSEGHLVTITSMDEQRFLASKFETTVQAWMGASDATTPGEWRWVDGPDAGELFWLGDASGSAQGFAFWYPGEPNDFLGTQSENSGLWGWDDIGGPGRWNDIGGELSYRFLVEYEPLLGDADGNSRVDLADFSLLKEHFGGFADYEHGDFNLDLVVDLRDFALLKTNFGASGAARVPEPTTLLLAAAGIIAGVVFCGRRT